MSSPSQIAEPSARPVSGLPGVAGAAAAGHSGKTYKAFGQDYQFAERMSNPFPELIISGAAVETNGPGTAVAAGTSQADGAEDGTGDSEIPIHRLSSSKESPARESVWAAPASAPWYKRVRKFWWATGIITILGIIGVVLAIVSAMGMFTGHSTSDDSSSAGNSTTTSPTSSSPSATPTRAAPTGLPKYCSDESSFIKGTVWVGIEGPYTSAFEHVTAAVDCCTQCLGSPGCAGWLYNGSTPYTPCTKIMVKDDRGDADHTCPNGYASTTHFSKGGDCVGGLGPCSHKAAVN